MTYFITGTKKQNLLLPDVEQQPTPPLGIQNGHLNGRFRECVPIEPSSLRFSPCLYYLLENGPRKLQHSLPITTL